MSRMERRLEALLERRVWLPAAALLVLGAALYLPMLGSTGLWDPWEPRYAQAAREMAAGNDWLVPHYRLDERLNKPPLTYWLIGVSHAVFGVTETAARLPSALFAIFTAALLTLGFSLAGRKLEGFIAGAALLTAPQWILLGRSATPDMPLAGLLGLALALVLILSGTTDPRRKRILQGALVIAIVLAGLTDWPRGLLLPAWGALGWGALRWRFKGVLTLGVVAGLYHAGQMTYSVWLNLASFGLAAVFLVWLLRSRVGVPARALAIGGALVLLLVMPWFVVVNYLEPDEMMLFEYKHGLNLGESVERHTGDYHDVVRIAGVGGLPWLAAGVVGMIAGIWPRRDEMAGILAGAWIGGTLFFTLSEAQMGHFYGVLQPSMAGLAGIGVVALVRKLNWTVIPAAAVLIVYGRFVWLNPSRLLETGTVKRSLFGFGQELSSIVAGVLIAWVLMLIATGIRGRPVWALASILPAALLAGSLAFRIVPGLEPMKSMRPLWLLYNEHRQGDEPLGLLGRPKDGCFYYSDNAAVRIKKSDQLEEFIAGPGAKYLISTTGAARDLRKLPGSTEWIDDAVHPSHRLIRWEPRAGAGPGPR